MSIEDCPVGHECNEGEMFACLPGFYANETKTVACLPCGATQGFTQFSGSDSCTKIPVGWFGIASVSYEPLSFSGIAMCPRGHSCTAGFKTACKPGYYQVYSLLTQDVCSTSLVTRGFRNMSGVYTRVLSELISCYPMHTLYNILPSQP